ncbi:MAG: IS66 family transposase [Streptomycetales bacterium]
MTSLARRQVFDMAPPPSPRVSEYQVQTRRCVRGGRATTGQVPAGVVAPVQYGPEAAVQAANVICGHYVPVHRAGRLVAGMVGVAPSTGWLAGLRGRAAAALEDTFLPHVPDLLRTAGRLHVDETPARAAGRLT